MEFQEYDPGELLNSETGFYEMTCPFCGRVTVLGDDDAGEEHCGHLVYEHETVNGRLLYWDDGWMDMLTDLLERNAEELEEFQEYIEDYCDEDEEGLDIGELAEKYACDFIEDGGIPVRTLSRLLDLEGMDDVSDGLVVKTIVDVETGNGTSFVYYGKE